MMLYYKTKFGCEQTSSLENIVESHIFVKQAIAVTLTLKTANQFFCMTLNLKIIHHHAMFG